MEEIIKKLKPIEMALISSWDTQAKKLGEVIKELEFQEKVKLDEVAMEVEDLIDFLESNPHEMYAETYNIIMKHAKNIEALTDYS